MDELSLRMEQTYDLCQVQLRMATEGTLRVIRQYSDEGSQIALRAINNSTSLTAIQNLTTSLWEAILRGARNIKNAADEFPNPEILYEQLRVLLRDEICRNNAFFICVGLGVGTMGGFLLGMWIARPHAAPVMKSIACPYLRGIDYVNLCSTPIPTFKQPTDILIRVRAATINRLDAQIANGYGRNLRRMIQSYNNTDNIELPLVLGRACAGIVEGVGRGTKSGLEIGDEVWLASPWYSSGLCSEIVVAPESQVARKPYIIGYEGAASLPYSGCVALEALKLANLNELTTNGKRILVQDGCSPVGCVLTQLVNKWGGQVTSTCQIRAVPVIKALGSNDVISYNLDSENSFTNADEQLLLFKELSIRKEYDVVFFTTATDYNKEFIRSFVIPNGIVIDTVELPMRSDEFGELTKLVYSMYVRLKKICMKLMKSSPDWGGPHLCHRTLDRLAEYVNEGILQTVVDQVYTPQDAENAISHVCSAQSIGSTIVTFRS